MESLATALFEEILTALLTSDFELYYQNIPITARNNVEHLREVFDEAVGVLKPMGDIKSIKYLTHEKMTALHKHRWKVRYQKENEDLLFEVLVTNENDDLQFKGFAFDK